MFLTAAGWVLVKGSAEVGGGMEGAPGVLGRLVGFAPASGPVRGFLNGQRQRCGEGRGRVGGPRGDRGGLWAWGLGVAAQGARTDSQVRRYPAGSHQTPQRRWNRCERGARARAGTTESARKGPVNGRARVGLLPSSRDGNTFGNT